MDKAYKPEFPQIGRLFELCGIDNEWDGPWFAHEEGIICENGMRYTWTTFNKEVEEQKHWKWRYSPGVTELSALEKELIFWQRKVGQIVLNQRGERGKVSIPFIDTNSEVMVGIQYSDSKSNYEEVSSSTLSLLPDDLDDRLMAMDGCLVRATLEGCKLRAFGTLTLDGEEPWVEGELVDPLTVQPVRVSEVKFFEAGT